MSDQVTEAIPAEHVSKVVSENQESKENISDQVTDGMEALDLSKKSNEEQESTDDFVDPWNVVTTSKTGIDYEKLISNT